MDETPDSVVSFYDELASDYHLIYGKWEEAMTRQSKALDSPTCLY